MKVFLLIILTFSIISCGKKTAEEKVIENLENDKVSRIDSNEDKMKEAIAQARKTVDEFIEALESNDPNIKSLSVKVPLNDGEQIEHIWLGNISYKDENFTGNISNEIKKVKGFKNGQEVTFSKENITDWMYIKGDVAQGNVTLKALFHTMDPEEVKVLKKMMGWSSEQNSSQ